MARVKWFTDEARWLMTAGAIAAARMHAHGMPVDVGYCKQARADLKKKMAETQDKAFNETDGGRAWVKKYGADASLSNDNQLRYVLFEALGLEPQEGAVTKTGRLQVGKDAIDDLNDPLVDLVLAYGKYEKAANTFLAGIIRETVDGVLHPFFHVCGFEGGTNTVVTYRSSSSDPNFQNMPIRDPEIGKIIRSSFRAPPGWCIWEADYSGLEVHSNAWYHKDPVMLKYLADGYDFHRDFTLECFKLTPEEYAGLKPKPKALRNVTKNAFTFPEFYGSYWKQVAAGLWKKKKGVTLANGMTVEQHMARRGIKGLGELQKDDRGNANHAPAGTFYKHLQTVEQSLWKRFAVYNKWRETWYKAYQKEGGFTTLTGFRHEGVFRRNEVINTPGQGTGSQCKLRGLIGLTQALVNRKMEGYPVAEIHDSIVGLCPEEEVDAVLRTCQQEMVDNVKAAWPFIITPLGIEADVCPPGGTWYEKAARAIPGV